MPAKYRLLHQMTVSRAVPMPASPGARHVPSAMIQMSLNIPDTRADPATCGTNLDRRTVRGLGSWCRATKLATYQETGLLYDVHAAAQNHK